MQKSSENHCKIDEIKHHLKTLFLHYGEDMELFDEILDSMLSLGEDNALISIRNLIKQLKWMPKNEIKSK